MRVRASEQKGIRKAREALTRKGWKQTKLLEEAKSRNQKLSSQQLSNFFQGKAVERSTADKIGFLLDLTWEDGDLEPELGKKKQDKGSDIDELVQEVRSRCCDKVQHLYSKIQLLNRQQIDVDQLYVDVYVLEKLASEFYATISGLLKGSDLRNDFERLGLGQRGKRSPGFEVAAQYPRLMILGKPGSGKTTFLRHLAVACCKGEFQADHIPILIELKDIKDISRFDLLNKIHKEFGLVNQAPTEQILNQGNVLILLDGLDEVLGQSKRDVQDHIYEFSQQYYKNHFILTCRTQTTEYTLPTFKYVEVADFKLEQVEIFAENWFTALAETPQQGAELVVKFLDKLRLPENKQTAELAVTPILLSLTCWVFDDLKDLPPKRSDLYEQGINLLLEKWDEKRGVMRDLGSEAYRKLSIREKKKLLSYLAARKFEQEQYVVFEQGELQRCIAEYLGISTEDSEAVLNAIEAQHGLLIERAQGFWSFSHLTFQEYFAAKWFCDRADWNSLVNQITDKKWREVFLLVVEILPSADRFLQLMKQQVDLLIANDNNLQMFLFWIYGKSLSVKDNYLTPVALRVFYLCLEYIFGVNLFDPDQVIDLAVRFKVEIGPGSECGNASLDFDRKLYYLLDISWIPDKNMLTNDIEIILDYIRSECILKYELQQLQYDLLKLSDSEEKFTKVWSEFNLIWTKRLRNMMINYRNIGHDWKFSKEQRELLKNYYDANELLVECLDTQCDVSQEVSDEIENKLLLPMKGRI